MVVLYMAVMEMIFCKEVMAMIYFTVKQEMMDIM